MKVVGLILSILAVVAFMAVVNNFKDSNDKDKEIRTSYFDTLGVETTCRMLKENNYPWYLKEVEDGRC